MRSKISKKYRNRNKIFPERKNHCEMFIFAIFVLIENLRIFTEILKFLEIEISVRNGWIPTRYSHSRWVAETYAGFCRDSPSTTARRSHQSCSRIFQQFKSKIFPRLGCLNNFFIFKLRPSVMLNSVFQMNQKIKTVKSNLQLLLIRHKMMTKR